MSEPFPGRQMMVSGIPSANPASGSHKRSTKRERLPPVLYDENDRVMRDIQERMREKRRRNADLSRSRRGNLSNASKLLRLSLRANNHALAKALEEARCEAQQDKEMIYKLQWALDCAQQELRQARQTIQDLEFEGQTLAEMVTQLRISEDKHRQNVSEVKRILNDVTANQLLNTVSLLDKAVSICNRTPSFSKGSSIFVRKLSETDDNSRDTLSAPVIDPNEPQRPNIYNKNRAAASKIVATEKQGLEDAVVEESPEAQPKEDAPVLGDVGKDHVTPNRLSSGSTVGKRLSSTKKRPRTSFLLDPLELQQALCSSEAKHQSLIAEESGDILDTAVSGSTDCLEREMVLSNSTGVSESPAVTKDGKDRSLENAEGGGDDEAAVVDNTVKPTDKPVDKPTKAEKKKSTGTKRPAKGGKSLKKVSKKLTLKKAINRKIDNGSLQEHSVFDLSASFSKPASETLSNHNPKFGQDLSTESEKSEPGDVSCPTDREDAAGNDIDVLDRRVEQVQAQPARPDTRVMDPDDRPLDVQNPQTRRKSRQSHVKLFKKLTNALSCDVILDNGQEPVVAQPSSLGRDRGNCKELGQILNESSFIADVDMEETSALMRKPTFHKKMARIKQKKKLYDLNRSLDKEATHAILKSPVGDDPTEVIEDNKGKRSSATEKPKSTTPKEVGIADESLNGVLGEPWMKDFLNKIDGGENEQVPSSRSEKNPRLKEQSRKTFEVLAADEPETRRGLNDAGGKANKEKRTIRRGTVCIKKKQSELQQVGNTMLGEATHSIEYNKAAEETDKRTSRRGTVCIKKKSEVDQQGNAMMQEASEGIVYNSRADQPDKQTSRSRRGTVCIKKRSEVEQGESTSSLQDSKDSGYSKSAKEKDQWTDSRGTVIVGNRQDLGESKTTNSRGHDGDNACSRDNAQFSEANVVMDDCLNMEGRTAREGKRTIRRGTVCLNNKITKATKPAESSPEDVRGDIQSKDAADKKMPQGAKRGIRRGTVCLEKRDVMEEVETALDGGESPSQENEPDHNSDYPIVQAERSIEQNDQRQNVIVNKKGILEDSGAVGHPFENDRGSELSEGSVQEVHPGPPVETKSDSAKDLGRGEVKKVRSLVRRGTFEIKPIQTGGEEEQTEAGKDDEGSSEVRVEELAHTMSVMEKKKKGKIKRKSDELASAEDDSEKSNKRVKRKEEVRKNHDLGDNNFVEDRRGADMEENVHVDDIARLEEAAAPARRKSRRVSERVSVERKVMKKTALVDRVDKKVLEGTNEADDGGVPEVESGTVSCATPPLPTPKENIKKRDSKNVKKKTTKEGKEVKKRARKSKKKAVPPPEDSEGEFVDDDLSLNSAKILQELECRLKEEGGLREERSSDQRRSTRVVHFEGGDHGIDPENEKKALKDKGAKTKKAGAKRVKKEGRKNGSMELEKSEDRVSRTSSMPGAVAAEFEGQRHSKGEAGVRETVDESGDASIPGGLPTSKETIQEECARRSSRPARAKAAKNMKEPSLNKKLRQGDPFTDGDGATLGRNKSKMSRKKEITSRGPFH